jgi:hypothetical protein
MVFPLKAFKSWVSHRIDDSAVAFVTPPLKKDKKTGKKIKKPPDPQRVQATFCYVFNSYLCGWIKGWRPILLVN